MSASSLARQFRGHASARLTRADGEVLLSRLTVARGVLRRGIGLMGRGKVPRTLGDGLLFLKCRDLHTLFMRFPLDVAFLDESGACVEIRRGVGPWKLVRGPKAAQHVFEVPAGALDHTEGEGWRWSAE